MRDKLRHKNAVANGRDTSIMATLVKAMAQFLSFWHEALAHRLWLATRPVWVSAATTAYYDQSALLLAKNTVDGSSTTRGRQSPGGERRRAATTIAPREWEAPQNHDNSWRRQIENGHFGQRNMTHRNT
jgi:hypothetical protein